MIDQPDLRIGAARVGAVADLLDVRLTGLETTLHSLELADRYRADLGVPQVAWEVAGSALLFEVEAALSVVAATAEGASPAHDAGAAASGTSTGDGAPLLDVSVRYVVVYRVPEDFELDPSDADAFGQVSVLFSVYPYYRELLNSLTVRAGLPPLVLGTLRSPVDPPVKG